MRFILEIFYFSSVITDHAEIRRSIDHAAFAGLVEGKTTVKEIYVPNKIVNIVVK